MKKFLLSLSTAALVAHAAAAAGIQETPQGDAYDNIYRSSEQYLLIFGSLYISNIEGKMSSIVIDGNDFYMFKPVNTFSISAYNYWIKGTLGDDNTVTFAMPQEVYIQPANPYSGAPETQISATMMKAVTTDGVTDFVTVTEDNKLVMKWENNTLSQVNNGTDDEPLILGLIDSDGLFTGSAEGNMNWSIFDETLPTPPADLVTATYLAESNSGWGEDQKRIVEIGTSGNELWIKGLYGYFADSWIKGTIDGDKVTLATDQYLGIYTTEMYYYFFQAANAEESISEWGEPEYKYIPQAAATLTKEGDKYIADNALLMTFGMRTANPGMPSGSVLLNTTFTPYTEVPATPANPSIGFIGDYYAPYGRSVNFSIPATDTDGNYINPDNMYYNIFINGELFTFTTETYPMLNAPMTDIPYNFSETGVVMTNGGSADHNVTLMIEELPEIAIQSAYVVNGETRKSAVIGTTSSISDTTVGTPEVVATEWYNMQGMRINAPENGSIAIRRDRLSDGSVKTAKVIR